jgi:hypothetical protein
MKTLFNRASKYLLFFLIILLLSTCINNSDGTFTVIPIAPTTLKATTFFTTLINF